MAPTPRYTSLQRVYFSAVIAAGASIATKAALEVLLAPPPSQWLLLGALTLLTGSFTIRIPRLSIRISVSDAFVFASALLFGTAVATVIVAIDSVVATLWMRRENRSFFRSGYNLAVASLSIWVAATTFFLLAGELPSPEHLVLSTLLWPLFLLAAIYFLLNSWMIAAALSFEQRANVVRLWWKHFPWFSLNYFGGVSAAALLVSYTRSVDIGAVSIILPLLLISYLTYRTSLGRVQDAQRHLEQMNDLYISTIEALAMAVDAKDQITHGHIRRVQVYAVELAKRLGVSDEQQLLAIETAALLHDMGKLAIPEHILNKPGKLSPAEFDKMKRHADIGADLLSSIRFPYPVVPIVRYHHENWNGTGYPSGLSGADIPLGARILSVVDCFDALTSDRPYRPRLSDEEAFQIIRDRRGTMYDPLVVDTFVRVHTEISPAAIKAGQEARSMVSARDALFPEEPEPMTQIRANAAENVIFTELARGLEESRSHAEALSVIARALGELMPSDVFALFRYEVESDSLSCCAATGPNAPSVCGIRVQLGERVVGWTAANRRTSVNSDATLDLGATASDFSPQLRSTLCSPVIAGDTLLGVVAVYSSAREGFSRDHSRLLENVAAMLTPVLQSRPQEKKPVVSLRAAG